MLLEIVDWLTYGVMGLSADTHIGGAVNFFIYDSVKIMLRRAMKLQLIAIFFGVTAASYRVYV